MKTKTIVIIHFILLIFLAGCSSTPEPKIISEIKVYDVEEKNVEAVDRFKVMDAHALAAPDSVKASMSNLVDYLIEPAQTDLERVRVIYRWITDNIAYDTDAFFTGQYGDTSPEGVLDSGKSICSGYSGLFKSLLDLAGVPAVEINGYAKGYGYTEGKTYSRTNHAWNAVEIEEEWYFIDTTWAAGFVNGRDFNKRLEEFWFLTPPDQYIFSHLPKDPQWQLLDQVISKERFEELPNLKGQLFKLGITSKQVMDEIYSEGYRGFPKFFTAKYKNLTAYNMPVSKYLEKNQTYNLKFFSEDIKSISIIQNGKFTYFEEENGEFTLDFKAVDKGIVKISCSTVGKTFTHYSFVHFEVE